jgi:hypothetical protein
MFELFRRKIKPANQVTVEGVVHSTWPVFTGTPNIEDNVRTDIVRYRIRVIVEGLDMHLFPEEDVKMIVKGVHIDPALRKKGDRVVVVYDRTKPRRCKIIETKTERSVE